MKTKNMSAKGRSSFGRKYKALFLDLDGTTVALGRKIPSERVIQAVLQADKLVHVCLATGRVLANALPVIEALKLSGLCVISNGIQIYDPQKRTVLEEIRLNEGDIPYILEVMRKYNLPIRYFDGETDQPFSDDLANLTILSLYVDGVDKKIAEKVIADLTFLPEISTHQMIVDAKDSNKVGLEVAHVRATKQHGISEVAKRLKISTKEIIGIGDGYNDFPLLMACGLRVAMDNAVPELKEIADFIAPPVEENGVATVIEKYIL